MLNVVRCVSKEDVLEYDRIFSVTVGLEKEPWVILTLIFRVAKLLFLLLRRRNMPSLPSYGTGPRAIIPFSDFIRYGDGLLVTVLT